MTFPASFTIRRVAAFAIGSLLVAGCGGGDDTPHPVDQPLPTTNQANGPNQIGSSNRSPGEQLTPDQAAEESQKESARRGLWIGVRPRSTLGEWTMEQTVVDALTRIGQASVPALINLLNDPKPQLRAEAVIALARIGPEARSATPRLIDLVEHDPDEAVRKNAVRALGQIGPAAAPAVPVLVEELRSAIDAPAGGGQPSYRGATGQGSTDSSRPTGAVRPNDGR